MKKGIVFLISGPSGVGKKTLIDKFINKPELNLQYSISMTTRPMRPGEVDKKDYFFVDENYFKKQIEQGNMLEYAQFFGCYYGTPQSHVINLINQGINVLLEIEVIGAKQIMQKMPEAVTIFIMPPSLDILRNRLIKRNTETIEKINIRLNKAKDEVFLKDHYKYNVVNTLVETASCEIKEIIKKEIELLRD